MRERRIAINVIYHIFVVAFGLMMIYPVVWMIISSFKTSDELLRTVPTLWPGQWVWYNYPNVLQRAPFGRYLVNTLITTLCIMAGELTIGGCFYDLSNAYLTGKAKDARIYNRALTAEEVAALAALEV